MEERIPVSIVDTNPSNVLVPGAGTCFVSPTHNRPASPTGYILPQNGGIVNMTKWSLRSKGSHTTDMVHSHLPSSFEQSVALPRALLPSASRSIYWDCREQSIWTHPEPRNPLGQASGKAGDRQ